MRTILYIGLTAVLPLLVVLGTAGCAVATWPDHHFYTYDSYPYRTHNWYDGDHVYNHRDRDDRYLYDYGRVIPAPSLHLYDGDRDDHYGYQYDHGFYRHDPGFAWGYDGDHERFEHHGRSGHEGHFEGRHEEHFEGHEGHEGHHGHHH